MVQRNAEEEREVSKMQHHGSNEKQLSDEPKNIR